MQRSRKTEYRVGIFVMVALVIGGIIAFSLGDRRSLFTGKDTYFTAFADVGGLRPGSPVHVGGVNVGTVAGVSFRDDGRIRVKLQIAQSASYLIREGSTAQLTNKGMLGDKLVTIAAGKGEPLPEGSTIPSDESASLSQYLDKAGRILTAVEETAENLRSATEPFSEPEFAAQVRETTRNVAAVTKMAAEGEGTVQRLLTDRQMADRIASAVRNLEQASAELTMTARSIRAVADEVRSGDGTAHQLIYGDEGTRMIRNFADAAGEVATLLGDVREGEGTVHKLIYGSEGDDLIANLTQVSEDLKVISGDVRAGRGTIGGLLRDPSIYEDVKRLVGDLQRNEILRALVRYSIRRDDQVEPVEVEPVAD